MKPVMREKPERASLAALLGGTRVTKYLVMQLLFWAAVACAQPPASSEEAQTENTELLGASVIGQGDKPSDGLAAPDLTSFTGQLTAIVNRIPKGEEANFGFASRDELAHARLGLAYQEYSLTEAEPTGYWRVQVVAGEQNRVLIRIKEDPRGQWEFAGMSGAQLSRELGRAQQELVEQGTEVQVGRIVRDFDFKCDYVQYNPVSATALDGDIFPLTSAKMFLKSELGIGEQGILAQGYDLAQITAIRAKAKGAWKHQ